MAKLKNLTPDFSVAVQDFTLREGTAVSNIDGRLWNEVSDTGRYFSDEAMVKARIGIEALYLVALSEVGMARKISLKEKKTLLELHQKITPEIYGEIRKIEASTRHDLVATTQMFKKLLADTTLVDIIDHGWVHWGLTTEDVDNISRSCLITGFLQEVFLPRVGELLIVIADLAEKYKEVVFLGRTHLQPAIPTTLGKEIALYGLRLSEQFEKIQSLKLRGKLTGAVGNLSAHKAVKPGIGWHTFSKEFVESLGLEANLYTTQVEPKNKQVELYSHLQLLNSILIDISQNMRIMTGFEWLVQEVKQSEVGSSAMPQKINPIDFENACGNALFANWIFEGLVRQLPISWLQRDLVDKTIQRNMGVPFGHSLIAVISMTKGFKRISPNSQKIKEDLEKDWSILSEYYQTYLRFQGKGDAYESLKELSRGKVLTKKEVQIWIKSLKIDEKSKNEMLKITPNNYIGYAAESAKKMSEKIRKIVLLINQ